MVSHTSRPCFRKAQLSRNPHESAALLRDVIYPQIALTKSSALLFSCFLGVAGSSARSNCTPIPCRKAQDHASAALLRDVIYPEEITHCAAGVRWLRHLHALALANPHSAIATSTDTLSNDGDAPADASHPGSAIATNTEIVTRPDTLSSNGDALAGSSTAPLAAAGASHPGNATGTAPTVTVIEADANVPAHCMPCSGAAAPQHYATQCSAAPAEPGLACCAQPVAPDLDAPVAGLHAPDAGLDAPVVGLLDAPVAVLDANTRSSAAAGQHCADAVNSAMAAASLQQAPAGDEAHAGVDKNTGVDDGSIGTSADAVSSAMAAASLQEAAPAGEEVCTGVDNGDSATGAEEARKRSSCDAIDHGWVQQAQGHACVEEWFHKMTRKHFKGGLKPPFNDEARRLAGFTEEWYLPLVDKAWS